MQVQKPFTYSSGYSTHHVSCLSFYTPELESIRFNSGGSCEKLPYKWELELAVEPMDWGWTGLEKKNKKPHGQKPREYWSPVEGGDMISYCT